MCHLRPARQGDCTPSNSLRTPKRVVAGTCCWRRLQVIHTTKENIATLAKRRPAQLLGNSSPPLMLRASDVSPPMWSRLLATYAAVDAKLPTTSRKRAKKRVPHNITVYPLEVAVRFVRHYQHTTVSAEALAAVEHFWLAVAGVG